MVELQARAATAWRVLTELPAAARARIRVLDGRRRRGSRPAARTAAWCGSPDGTVLIATGTTCDSRATRPIARTSRRRASNRARRRRCIRDLRAAAESGWDFSSRWFADGRTLATDPHDGHRAGRSQQPAVPARDAPSRAAASRAAARLRRQDMRAHARARARRRCGADVGRADAARSSTTTGASRQPERQVTAATAYPLFVGLAERSRRRARVAATIRAHAADAARPRDDHRGHRPAMGCAQWLGAAAVDRDRRPATPRREASWRRPSRERWVAENARVYCSTGKLVEKYNVRDAGAGGGRRVSGAGRLRLDQRRADQTTRAVSEAREAALRIHRRRLRVAHGFRRIRACSSSSSVMPNCASSAWSSPSPNPA